MAKNDGGPAFPAPGVYGSENVGHQQLEVGELGMSLREYFAAHAPAMPDEWASLRRTDPENPNDSAEEEVRILAEWRWHYADAMLAAREKK